MEEEVGAAGRVPRIEVADPSGRELEERRVAGLGLLLRVGEVGEEREAEVRIAVREAADLESLEEGRDVRWIVEQCRHDDECAEVVGDAVLQRESGKPAGRNNQRDPPVRDRYGELAGDEHAGTASSSSPRAGTPRAADA